MQNNQIIKDDSRSRDQYYNDHVACIVFGNKEFKEENEKIAKKENKTLDELVGTDFSFGKYLNFEANEKEWQAQLEDLKRQLSGNNPKFANLKGIKFFLYEHGGESKHRLLNGYAAVNPPYYKSKRFQQVAKIINDCFLDKNQDNKLYFVNKACYGAYFFNELKIGPFYELDIEVKKDWLGIFCTIFIGALEIAAGCILMCYTGGRFGSEFIEEGYDDIKYGIECLAGKKEFSWSDFKKKKLNFLIKTAVSLAMKLLTAGFSDMFCSKSKLGFKTVFKQVAKKIVKKAAIEVGKEVAAHLIGPEIMEKIISKVKSVLKDGVVKYFGNKLKSLIPNEILSMMCINIVIYKGKNPIQRLLVDQLKNSVHVLGDILNFGYSLE